MRPKSREKGLNLLFSLPKLYYYYYFLTTDIKLFNFKLSVSVKEDSPA